MRTRRAEATPAELRRRAETMLRATPREIAAMSTADLSHVVHELQVHQVELEIQNEELLRAQSELAESRDRYVDLYDFAPVGYVSLDAAGRIDEANLAAAALLGVERARLVGVALSRFVARASQDAWHLHRRATLTHGAAAQTCEIEIARADGQRRVLHLESSPFDDGGQARCRTALIDITARTQAEQALRASQDRLQLALSAASAGAWDADVASGTTHWSDGLYELLGYRAGSVAPGFAAWAARVHPDDVSVAHAALRGCAEGDRESCALEFRAVWPDRSEHWLNLRAGAMTGAGGGRKLFGVVIDVTGVKRAEIALRRARDELEARVAERTAELQRRGDQLARLASDLILTEKRERHRLAQVLHDHLQQILVSARYALEVPDEGAPGPVRDALRSVDELLMDAMTLSRSLTAELSPSVLYERGLPAGLEWLRHRVKEKKGLDVALRVDPGCTIEREDVRLLLFESIREALFNVAKHAGVSRAEVRLERLPSGRVRAEVSDAGHGFDVGSLAAGDGRATAGFGLFSIRERLGLLGGQLRIDSAPGAGTRLTMEVPVPGSEDDAAADGPGRHAPPPAGADATRDRANGPAAPSATRIRVLLVDDHRVVREGVAALLGRTPDIVVVGQAADGREGVERARELQPDVILMDYSMPEMNGAQATRAIHAAQPWVRIIGLSMFDEPSITNAMLAAGASAFMTKGGDSQALLAQIRAVMQS